jgi:hypothetical protein
MQDRNDGTRKTVVSLKSGLTKAPARTLLVILLQERTALLFNVRPI